MKLFDIDYTDQLSEQQVRYLLNSQLVRNKLLVKQNKFTFFRYEVSEDTMILLSPAPDGTTAHSAFEHYFEVNPPMYFDDKEHARIVASIKHIIEDPDYPKTGSEDFFYKDGSGVTIEYTALFDAEGRVISLVGQLVDVYQTHERLLDTIRTLNQQLALTDSIRHSYETMLTIDLRNYSFDIIHATQEVRMASSKVKTVLQLAELFCQYYVEPEYHEGFNKFVNEGTISDRLLGNRYLAYEYMTRNIGWCRARIMPSEIDSSGRVIKAVFTTECAPDHHEALSVLRVAASTDALTGLKNRYSGEKAIHTALESKQGFIYALFDCDFFKSINDKLGHPTGDKVLIEVAKALAETFQDETVMRLGGDEFVVFITSPDLIQKAKSEGMAEVFKPLRQRLQQIFIPHSKSLKPSLSCGAVLASTGTGYELAAIYEMADKKLYEAKSTHNGAFASIELS